MHSKLMVELRLEPWPPDPDAGTGRDREKRLHERKTHTDAEFKGERSKLADRV